MKVTVHNLVSETQVQFDGSQEHIRDEILRHYPWLAGRHQETVYDLVEHLQATQAFDAQIEDHDYHLQKAEYDDRDAHVVRALLGNHHGRETSLAAAKFLAGPDRILDHKLHRDAMHEHNGCHKKAALAGYGIEINEKNLKALDAISALGTLNKSAFFDSHDPEQVEACTSDAQEYAQSIRHAMTSGQFVPVELGGKHSAGTFMARDGATDTVLLLKPGSGGPGPAAGSADGPQSPVRETAFYHVGDYWMLGDYLPETQLVRIDGEEYAAIQMLPWTYKTVDDLNDEHPNAGADLLRPYQASGTIWKWAVLDLVLHNVDRHANNLMADPDNKDVKLIDQGAAFAGSAFDPADDKATFIPYYLRAWAPDNFNTLSPLEKLKAMPRMGRSGENELRQWIENLDETELTRILAQFKVNPEPHLMTMRQLKAAIQTQPADLAVNSLWLEI